MTARGTTVHAIVINLSRVYPAQSTSSPSRRLPSLLGRHLHPRSNYLGFSGASAGEARDDFDT
jgi:hypothetical protein